MIKSIFVAFLLFFSVVIFIPDVNAAEDFATAYDVTYDIGLDGMATVTEKITLKNLTSQYYASQFSLNIGATQISEVSASDSAGSLDVKTEQKDTSTTLSVRFNQQVAGLGKTYIWSMRFKSSDFASHLGKIWEVSIPKVTSTAGLESYNVTLVVPQSFGQPTQISPTPKTETSSFDKMYLSFDKDQLQTSGVSANFGDKQLFDFDLNYHLENPNLVPALTSIALPPDTGYQDIIFTRIDPKPVNVTVDEDGNYLAWYKLARGQKLSVKVLGSAKLYSSSKVKNPTLIPNLREKYLTSAKYWEKEHPAIKQKLDEILGQNFTGSNMEKSRLIFNFVVNYLKYDASRLKEGNIDRLGAVAALNNPSSAVCMEFTDLFIALSRAAGIPARELDGFAYTANSKLRPLSLSRDVLHAWPEIYDENRGWVMIDPTWQNTTGGVDYFNKFDLNHFVFAIKGLSSEQPAPAGSYKYIGQDSRDVQVLFSENDFLGKSQLNISINTPSPVIAGLPGKIKVRIENLGNALQQSAIMGVNTGTLAILGGSQNTGPIPAFGFAEFEFDVRSKSLFDNYNDVVEVSLADKKIRKEVIIKPFFSFQGLPLGIVFLVAAVVLIYSAVLAGFIFRRRLRKTS